MFLLASLVAIATVLSPVALTDTTLAVPRGAVCVSAPAVSATVMIDLRAALVAHGGVVRWEPARGQVRLWVQRRPDAAADVSITTVVAAKAGSLLIASASAKPS